MSPFGPIAMPDGMLNGSPMAVGEGSSLFPSVRSTSPPGLCSVAMW